MTRAATSSSSNKAIPSAQQALAKPEHAMSLWTAIGQSSRMQLSQRLADMIRQARVPMKELPEGGSDESR